MCHYHSAQAIIIISVGKTWDHLHYYETRAEELIIHVFKLSDKGSVKGQDKIELIM